MMKKKGISSLVHYEPLPHLTDAYRRDGWAKGAFPEAEQASSCALSLPIYPQMSENSVTTVIDAVRYFASGT